MCSRGTLGYPFLVGQIDHFLKTGKLFPLPSLQERLECAKEHLIGLWEYKGQKGIFQSRKHLSWYCQCFRGAAKLREQCSRINSVEEGLKLLDEAIRSS
jgi:tRNA-dihydrouridine synthase